MTYFPHIGDVEESTGSIFGPSNLVFNSTKFPGICKPMDVDTLGTVLGFQDQLNRVAHVKGFTKIGADGDIGPGTLALFRKVQAASGGTVSGNGSTCTGIANNTLHTIAGQVRALADRLGAPQKVSGQIVVKTPSIIDPKTNLEIKVPSAGAGLLGAFQSMSMPMKLAFGGILAGIGYFAFVETKKTKRR